MGKMQVFVVTRDGRKNIYEVDRFGKVNDLKVRIGRQLNVPMYFSRLAYKGHVLPNDCVLEDIGIKRMSTLELFWQPLVFSPKQFREKEMDIEKLEKKQMIVSSMTESYDQMVKSGGLLNGSTQSNPVTDSLDTFAMLPIGTRSKSKLQDIVVADDEELEDLSSICSDELEFLAAYRRLRNSDVKKAQIDDLESDDLENIQILEHTPEVGNELEVSASKLNLIDIASAAPDSDVCEIQLDDTVSYSNLKKKSKKNRKKK